MAVALSSNELERTIEVLSSAEQTLQLTRFERLSYRALLLSVDGVLVSYVLLILTIAISGGNPYSAYGKESGSFAVAVMGSALVLSFVFFVSIFAGVVSLALSIPLLRRTFREERRLKRLGLSSLSKSLWKESRRSRWISRLRGILLVGLILLAILGILVGILMGATVSEGRGFLFFLVPFYGLIAALLFAARYLRNQRERMDLAASAEELSKALVSLRQRKGSEGVSVPAELLERSARIESAQITKERKDAVLQSATFRPNAYAVAFDREAAQQRSTLGVADRVELEDLVAELSTNGAQLEAQTQPEASPGRLLRTTKSKGVEIEVVIDRASRGIRVIAVRHRGEASAASLNGAGHA
jgi:hypothetical protein